MTVYIIGKVDLTKVEETSKKFVDTQLQLMQQGYDATSIVKCNNLQWVNDKNIEAKERIRLVTNADAVFVLSDWGDDPLAMHEVAMAGTLCKRVVIASDTILPQRITFYTHVPEYNF